MQNYASHGKAGTPPGVIIVRLGDDLNQLGGRPQRRVYAVSASVGDPRVRVDRAVAATERQAPWMSSQTQVRFVARAS